MEAENCYYSVVQIVEFFKDIYPGYDNAVVYFENKDSFKNKFERLCVLPVLVQLKNKDSCKVLKHKDIIEKFDGKLYLSFGESTLRQLPEDKNKLCELLIDFKPKTFEDKTYYSSKVIICKNKFNIDKVRSQIVADIQYEEQNLDF